MKEIRKYTYIALGVVMALAILVAVLKADTVTVEDSTTVLSSREPTDVIAVKVRNAGGSYAIAYNYEEGGYTIDDLPMEYVDISGFIDYMTICGSVTAIRKVDTSGADPAAYGIEEPAAEVGILYADGEILNMKIGNREPVSGNYYMSTDDGSTVYMYPGDYAVRFLGKRTDFLSRNVTSPAIMSSPLSEITDAHFSGKKYDFPISIIAAGADPQARLDALSFGAATHIVRTKGVHQLDQTYGIEVLGSLLGVQSVDVAGYNVNSDELEKMGFADPDVAAVFDRVLQDKSIQNTELLLVEDTEEGGYLATVNGTGLVYRIAPPEFADIKVEKLLLRWFLTPMILDLDSIDVSDGENEISFELLHGENNDVTVLMDGEELDIGVFRKFFSLLTSATSADGEYLENCSPEGEPLFRLTYGYRNEAKEDDVMELFEGSLRRHDVAVNGTAEFDMAEGWLRAVKEAMRALKAGENFDINW